MTWCHIDDVERTARKQHKCFICAGPIEPKTKYVERNGVDGREHIRMRMHPVCKTYSDDWDDGDWETHAPGDIDVADLEDLDLVAAKRVETKAKP